MALRRGSIRPFRSNAARRIAKWSFGPTFAPLNMSATGQAIGTSLGLVDNTQVTLVRIRGQLQIFITSASSAGDGFDGAMGIGLVTREAFAAGATAVPGPISEMDWDGWVYHTFFHVHVHATANIPQQAPASFSIAVDSKAMRKWSEGYVLVPVLEQVEHGTAVAEAWFDSRLLVKLS